MSVMVCNSILMKWRTTSDLLVFIKKRKSSPTHNLAHMELDDNKKMAIQELLCNSC